METENRHHRHRHRPLNPHRHTSSSRLVPYSRRHLAVLRTASDRLKFSIPRGWGVEEVPRRDGSRSDLYYYEPGTGKRFRSIREIGRHLKGEYHHPRSRRSSSQPQCQNFRYRKMLVSGGKLMELDGDCDIDNAPTAPDLLPDGWILEEVPRRHANWVDKYYYEPGTGQKFRSLAGVERYLTELDDENAPLSKALEVIKENQPLSKLFKLESQTKPLHSQNSILRSKNVNGKEKQASSFLGPPSKVNWVVASPQGGEWNAFISDTLVSDTVKQQWGNRFTILMNNEG